MIHPTVKFWHRHLSNVSDVANIGPGAVIHSYAWIGGGVTIGNQCSIQAFVFIPNGVTIGNNVFLGPRVTFTNDKFPPSASWGKTTVEDRAVIGANATIIAGVTIGEGAMIGAGAVVTKDVPAGETWVGNPARKL